jgi:hypothetical protein
VTASERVEHGARIDRAATTYIQAAYLQADSTERRLFNQALFERSTPPTAAPAAVTKKRTPDPARVRGSDVPLLVVTLSP